jgi:MFS family permease
MSENRTSPPSAWRPLKRPFYRMLWIANSFSMIGVWMHDVGAAWLMTSLAPNPFMVAMIQTASALPLALLALPAGALADIFDRKRLILTTLVWRIIVSGGLGFITVFGYTTPSVLLVATFALGFGMAMSAPAWQAVIPDVVPRDEVPEAVTLGAVAFNVTRGVGPALGGFVVAAMGSGGTFLLNAASLFWITLVIGSWKHTVAKSALPEERLIGAIRTGIRYVGNSPEVKNALIHTGAFAICASAMWALLPIVAKQYMGLTSVGYGTLLGVFGIGCFLGVLILPRIRQRFTINQLISITVVLFSLVLFAMAYVRDFPLLACAMLIAGASWLALLSSLMASLQSVTPSWVLGRVMSVHALVFFGTQAAGSAFWGFAAGAIGLPGVLTGAGVLLIASLALTHRYKVTAGERLDLSPSREYTQAPLVNRPGMEEGPVLVTIEYRIDPMKASDFLRAMGPMKAIRRKYGAIRWTLFRDVADPSHYRESFAVESWVEHLRQHDRFTISDIAILERVYSFNLDGRPKRVDHFIAEPVPKVSAGHLEIEP